MCLCMYVNVWVFGVCFMCGHISVRTLCSKQQYGARCSQVTKKPRATAPCQWMSPIYQTNQPTHHPTKLINQPNLSIYPTNQPANSSTNQTYQTYQPTKWPSHHKTNINNPPTHQLTKDQRTDKPTNQLINQPSEQPANRQNQPNLSAHQQPTYRPKDNQPNQLACAQIPRNTINS